MRSWFPDACWQVRHLGREGLGIHPSLPHLALFVPVFPEILSKLFIFSEPVVTFMISALDGVQVQIFPDYVVGVFSLIQYYKATGAQVCPKHTVGVLFRVNVRLSN